MSSNSEIEAQMKLQAEDPRKQKSAQPKFAQSKFDKNELKAKKGETVWVKCVSELGPWASDQQLVFWEDYEVSVEEAIMLDERRFAVILEQPSKGE